MKKIILFLSVAILSGACRKESKGVSQLAGNWKLVTMEDFATHQVLTKDQVGEYDCAGRNVCDITMLIANPNSISGKTVVNEFSASFDYDASAKTFTLPAIATTKVQEMPWGTGFYDGMRKAESFTVSSTELHILYDNKTKALNFVRQ